MGTMNQTEFRRLPLTDILPSKTNPRSAMDEKGLKDLASSIKEEGVIEPVLVRPHSSPGKYEIIAGERRFRASQLAGVEDLPALVVRMDDRQTLEAQIIENLHREDLHPMDEARGYKRMLDLDGSYTPEVVAERAGKSKTYVYGRLALLSLDQKVQDLFYRGRLNVSAALRLARLQAKDQRAAMERFEGDETVSVRELDEWIRHNVFLDLHSAPFKKDDASLLPEAGPCTNCSKQTGNSPMLFPDIKKKSTCTDPRCFQAKLDRFVQIKAQEHPGTVKVALGYYFRSGADKLPSEVITEYRESKAGECPSTILAFVSHAAWHERDKIGSRVYICRDAECKVHWHSRRSSYETPEGRATRLLQQRGQKLQAHIERTIFYRLTCQLIERRERLRAEEWQVVAQAVLDWVGFYGLQDIAKYFGYDRKREGLGEDGKEKPYTEAGLVHFLERYVKELKPEEVPGFVLAFALRAQWRDVSGHCSRYGLNAVAIANELHDAADQKKKRQMEKIMNRPRKRQKEES